MKRLKLSWLAGVAGLIALIAPSHVAIAASLEDIPMDSNAEKRALAKAMREDPAWKPKFAEIAEIKPGKGTTMRNFCLNTNGNILACCTPAEIRVLSPEGKLITTWPLKKEPQAICVGKDGSIYVAGKGIVTKLDQNGQELATAASPVADVPVVIGKEIEEMLKEMKRNIEAERKAMVEQLTSRRAEVTGIAVTDRDVFISVPTPNEFTYSIYRFDRDLKQPKLVTAKLRGCCGQMDVQAAGEKLWIPHNGRHRVESHDRDGKDIAQFGEAGRVKPQHFGGCCEPKNLRVLSGGDIIVAESGPPTCFKRFSAAGKFLGVIGVLPGSEGDCVRVTVDANRAEDRFYMLDTKRDSIHVFGPKS